tara:strand:- start:2501 stop:3133 length:633 start_codon:yes stop_codon:yes gene_type:complete
MMKNILCFGDSLTWGVNAATGGRHPWNDRWTGVAQQHLGDGYRIIEEGLPGRTTVYDDPFSDHRNGRKVLPMLLESHAPLDLVVIQMGANDLQVQRPTTAREVAMGLCSLQQMVITSRCGPTFEQPPQCLIVSPPPLPKTQGLMNVLFRDRNEVFAAIPNELALSAATLEFPWIDAATLIESDGPDGVHLSAESNRILGTAIAEKIAELL